MNVGPRRSRGESSDGPGGGVAARADEIGDIHLGGGELVVVGMDDGEQQPVADGPCGRGDGELDDLRFPLVDGPGRTPERG